MKGILVVNKPQGFTSHDVIGKLRGILKERRMGHSGTLDPMATGVLPVFIGRATRAVEFCASDEKEYVAGLRLGVVTDTQDITGRIVSFSDGPLPGRKEVEEALRAFLGEIEQLPPMYSAVKVNGRKLCDIARKGETAERRARKVLIKEIELIKGQGRDYTFRIVCSKGTYVRTLCDDLGRALGCGGAMSSLVRTRAGRFLIDGAFTLDAVADAAEQGKAESLLLPIESVFSEYETTAASAENELKIRNGSPYECRMPEGRYRVFGENGDFLMLGEVRDAVMYTVKSFFEV
jgi:tRNA pseudouridine55 synthase